MHLSYVSYGQVTETRISELISLPRIFKKWWLKYLTWISEACTVVGPVRVSQEASHLQPLLVPRHQHPIPAHGEDMFFLSQEPERVAVNKG